jgi:hypothetical protein
VGRSAAGATVVVTQGVAQLKPFVLKSHNCVGHFALSRVVMLF